MQKYRALLWAAVFLYSMAWDMAQSFASCYNKTESDGDCTMTKTARLALGALISCMLVCGGVLFLPKEGGTIACITRNGSLLYEIDLNKETKQRYIEITAEDGTLLNRISVEPGRIRVEHANCPDQVCVEQGWIQDSALPIVCLPNKLIIEITGGEEGADAVTT